VPVHVFVAAWPTPTPAHNAATTESIDENRASETCSGRGLPRRMAFDGSVLPRERRFARFMCSGAGRTRWRKMRHGKNGRNSGRRIAWRALCLGEKRLACRLLREERVQAETSDECRGNHEIVVGKNRARATTAVWLLQGFGWGKMTHGSVPGWASREAPCRPRSNGFSTRGAPKESWPKIISKSARHPERSAASRSERRAVEGSRAFHERHPA